MWSKNFSLKIHKVSTENEKVKLNFFSQSGGINIIKKCVFGQHSGIYFFSTLNLLKQCSQDLGYLES